MATHRELQPAAHHHAVDRGHHRLLAGLHLRNHVHELGRCRRLGPVELADVGTAAEGPAAPCQHDREHCGIGLGAPDSLGDEAPIGQPEAVDGRVVHGQNGDAVAHFVAGGHDVLSVLRHKQIRTTMFLHAHSHGINKPNAPDEKPSCGTGPSRACRRHHRHIFISSAPPCPC
ncbi:hypothetical protein D9M72_558580 [compost metagenome]